MITAAAKALTASNLQQFMALRLIEGKATRDVISITFKRSVASHILKAIAAALIGAVVFWVYA